MITYNLRFIDSAKHMNSALSTLVDNLSEINKYNCKEKEDKDIKTKIIKDIGKAIIRKTCKTCNSKQDQLLNTLIENFPSTYKLCNKSTKKFILLLKKGIYPYEYMNSIDRFDEASLPSIDKFYSKLQVKDISENEYKHVKNVWDVFEIKTLGEYHDLHVKADTAQLTDVFENFRSLCLKEYQLDPAYFVSTPSLAFEAMLKITKAKIELFTDINMVLMTEKGIRGGLTQVVKKHAIANNKYLPIYDKSKKNVVLQYLDANNLYGYVMNKTLPLNGYKWADKTLFTDDFIKGDKGYLLEVDVEYQKKLLSAHKDLPFLPERRFKIHEEFEHKVSEEIEKAHKKVYKTFNITHDPENKLIATVQDKNKYVFSISTLKQALKRGLKLQQVHRVIEYNQLNWLKPYIDKNTMLRKEARNGFEKDFFKLMNNSVFGKMIENVRKRRDIKLIVT